MVKELVLKSVKVLVFQVQVKNQSEKCKESKYNYIKISRAFKKHSLLYLYLLIVHDYFQINQYNQNN